MPNCLKKNTAKGLGRTAADPKSSYITPDGYEIPKGVGVDSGANNTSLLYNEYVLRFSKKYIIFVFILVLCVLRYIVYDTAQIRMRYLLRVNFKYNY